MATTERDVRAGELLDTKPIGDMTTSEMLQSGAILMRIENDAMLAASLARPRDLRRVLANALAELELDPEEAHSARYSITYAKRGEGRRDDESEDVERVEGLSIRAAETLTRNFGNCSVSARLTGEDKEGFTVSGCFVDLETNYRVEKFYRVSKFMRLRNGRVISLNPQRMIMALQAGASKAQRNSSLAGLPTGLKSAYERKAISVAAGGDPDAKADEKTVARILEQFKKRWGLEPAQLEAALGRREHDDDTPLPREEWRGRHVADLRALWTALRDKQVTVEEVFGVGEAKAEDIKTPDTLVRATVTARDDAPVGSNAPQAPPPAQAPPQTPPAASGAQPKGSLFQDF